MKTKLKTKPVRKSEPKNKPTLVVFLLDRSGSMESVRQETIGGFNGYIDKLQKDDDGSIRFSMAQFDTVSHDFMYDCAPLKNVKKLDVNSFQPRGGTPLYDAMGKNIQLAERQAGKKYKVLFVTLTDGEENSSHEFDLDKIRSIISEREKNDHWTFAYIGMGLEGFKAAQHMSAGTAGASNVLRTDGKNAVRSYSRLAGQTMSYCADASAGVKGTVSAFWGKKDQDDTN